MIAAYTQRIMDALENSGAVTLYADEIKSAMDEQHALCVCSSRIVNAAQRVGVRIATRRGVSERGPFVYARVVNTSRAEDAALLRQLVDEHAQAMDCLAEDAIQLVADWARPYYHAIDRLERS